MKNLIGFLSIVFLAGLFSCEKSELQKTPKTYTEYLSDKAITSIKIYGNDIWISSVCRCTTCTVPVYASYIPQIYQLSLISGTEFSYTEPAEMNTPVMDHKGNLYAATDNTIYKVHSFQYKEEYLKTGYFSFNCFVFDKDDHIWFGGYNGIAYWNGTDLKVYNSSNSILPTNITHGLTIDESGIVWVALDFKGLLKITGDHWEIIPNTDIPGVGKYSYLTNPIADNNNIWFSVFAPDTTSNVLRFDGKWNYDYPVSKPKGNITIDSQGTVWLMINEYNYSEFNKALLFYYSNNEWINFDVAQINVPITAINVYQRKVYVGTMKGLYVLDK